MAIKPPSVPQQSREASEAILVSKGVDITKPCLMAIRGYYSNTFAPKGNNRSVFDDACFLVSPTAYVTWNYNCDPNGLRPGHGYGSSKGMATLKPGVWTYEPGIHRGYKAFVQGGRVTVLRDADEYVPIKDIVVYDGLDYYEDTGLFGINLHCASNTSTSSLGCNTWPPSQFYAARDLIYSELKRYNVRKFQYLLV